ncbi:Panacea domain-containing protein [Paraburkholderia acidipaludis]|uniref:Panacea domain-containing protein n=1 Tax=Paraburkholderia acidipaludis TaxID=660537 RepID=UPI0004887207|nr:Panacea domain-containing protein [Paraburkholderia acidipaludis]
MLTNHDRQKLVEAVLYFATKVRKLGKVKLFKLLYFLDFEHFRDTGRPVTGMDYVAWKMGPVPEALHSELSALDTAAGEWFGKVEFGSLQTKNGPMLQIKPLGEFDPRFFTKRELRILERLATEFKNSDATEMIEATHLENLPWNQVYVMEGKKRGRIPYEYALRKQEAVEMKSVVNERSALIAALKGPE